MRFDYFVIAAVTAVSTNALSIYNIITPVPGITSLNNEGGISWLGTLFVPDYCTKDIPISPPPTVAQLKICMKTADKVTDKAFFWSRVEEEKDYHQEAINWRAKYQPNLMMLDEFWLDDNVKAWAEAQGKRFGDKALAEFWSPASQAMAELSNGEVLVIMPANANPVQKPPVTRLIVWYDVEYPALKKNKNVKKLFKVSPGKGDKTPVPLTFAPAECKPYDDYETYIDYHGYGAF